MDANVGRIVNANMAEYLVPVHADIPAIDVLFVDEPDFSLNPIGAKGLGEIALVGVAPAIANAVYHATGQRIRDLPITLDKLLERDDATGKTKPGGSLPGSARRCHCSDDALSRPSGQAAKPSDREAGKEKG